MSEQFGIDGAFGNSAAVDGYEFVVFASAERVDDPRKNLLAHAALAGKQHSEVGGRHANGGAEGAVEQCRLPDDAEALFDGL